MVYQLFQLYSSLKLKYVGNQVVWEPISLFYKETLTKIVTEIKRRACDIASIFLIFKKGIPSTPQTPPRINESHLRHQYAIKTHTYE